eukprot:3381929-Pyramimonas_sp.AAC.1
MLHLAPPSLFTSASLRGAPSSRRRFLRSPGAGPLSPLPSQRSAPVGAGWSSKRSVAAVPPLTACAR